jgi:hypothetical protein
MCLFIHKKTYYGPWELWFYHYISSWLEIQSRKLTGNTDLKISSEVKSQRDQLSISWRNWPLVQRLRRVHFHSVWTLNTVLIKYCFLMVKVGRNIVESGIKHHKFNFEVSQLYIEASTFSFCPVKRDVGVVRQSSKIFTIENVISVD